MKAAYFKAGYNAYFGSGFFAGVEWQKEQHKFENYFERQFDNKDVGCEFLLKGFYVVGDVNSKVVHKVARLNKEEMKYKDQTEVLYGFENPF